MTNNGNNIAAFVICIIALVHGSFACLISAIIFIAIIYRLYKDRLKRENRITLILCANIYLMILIYTSVLVSLNIHTLLGDLYGQNFDSSWCTFRGYFVSVMLCALYTGFAVQAFFRLCRIVYSSYRWLQFYWFYVIVTPVQIIAACILLCPLLIWHDIIYLPNEHYCFTPFQNIRAMVWTAITNYGTPLFCLSIIYLRIIRFIRQQSNNRTLIMKSREERDFLVIKRIIIIVNILLALGVPSIILISMLYVTGVEYPLSYRITWLSTDVSMAVLSVLIVLMTPQLKNIIMKRWQRNRVMPMGVTIADSIEARAIRTIK